MIHFHGRKKIEKVERIRENKREVSKQVVRSEKGERRRTS